MECSGTVPGSMVLQDNKCPSDFSVLSQQTIFLDDFYRHPTPTEKQPLIFLTALWPQVNVEGKTLFLSCLERPSRSIASMSTPWLPFSNLPRP